MPYDVPTQREEQRQMERDSAKRQRAAGTSPSQSTGGKGWISGKGSGSANSAPAPGSTDGGRVQPYKPSAPLTASDLGGAQDTGTPGGTITNDDLGGARNYLGHFSRDDVAAKGHNIGHKKIGKAPVVQSVAKRGFRKLPGSASPQQGNARFGTMDAAQLGLRPPRAQRVQEAKTKAAMTRSSKKMMLQDPIPLKSNSGFGAPTAVNAGLTGHTKRAGGPPDVPSDMKMSIRHHKDSIKYNARHMEDHEREMVKHERELKTVERRLRGKRK